MIVTSTHTIEGREVLRYFDPISATAVTKSYLVKNIITLFFPSDEGQNKIFYSKRISSLESKKIGALSEGELKYL